MEQLQGGKRNRACTAEIVSSSEEQGGRCACILFAEQSSGSSDSASGLPRAIGVACKLQQNEETDEWNGSHANASGESLPLCSFTYICVPPPSDRRCLFASGDLESVSLYVHPVEGARFFDR